MEKEKVKFSVSISGTGSNLPCHFKIFIDETEFVHDISTIDVKVYELEAELTNSKHKLRIELLDKGPDHVNKTATGDLDENFLLNIKSIALDEIDLGTLIWTQSIYKPNSPQQFNNETVTELRNCVNLGWNGVWELEFESPIYIWLLENI